jgi:hypothetical protein
MCPSEQISSTKPWVKPQTFYKLDEKLSNTCEEWKSMTRLIPTAKIHVGKLFKVVPLCSHMLYTKTKIIRSGCTQVWYSVVCFNKTNEQSHYQCHDIYNIDWIYTCSFLHAELNSYDLISPHVVLMVPPPHPTSHCHSIQYWVASCSSKNNV